MPRPTQGHVVERPWADGETISYGTQVRAYGRYEWMTFGTNKQGWNRTRAELETERIMQQIERGTWVPPRLNRGKTAVRPRGPTLASRATSNIQFPRPFSMGTAGLEPATSSV